MDKLWRHFETGSSESILLTDEDIQLLEWLANGMTNREIAETKYWSETSVKRKPQSIYTNWVSPDVPKRLPEPAGEVYLTVFKKKSSGWKVHEEAGRRGPHPEEPEPSPALSRVVIPNLRKRHM